MNFIVKVKMKMKKKKCNVNYSLSNTVLVLNEILKQIANKTENEKTMPEMKEKHSHIHPGFHEEKKKII